VIIGICSTAYSDQRLSCVVVCRALLRDDFSNTLYNTRECQSVMGGVHSSAYSDKRLFCILVRRALLRR